MDSVNADQIVYLHMEKMNYKLCQNTKNVCMEENIVNLVLRADFFMKMKMNSILQRLAHLKMKDKKKYTIYNLQPPK